LIPPLGFVPSLSASVPFFFPRDFWSFSCPSPPGTSYRLRPPQLLLLFFSFGNISPFMRVPDTCASTHALPFFPPHVLKFLCFFLLRQNVPSRSAGPTKRRLWALPLPTLALFSFLPCLGAFACHPPESLRLPFSLKWQCTKFPLRLTSFSHASFSPFFPFSLIV